MDAQKAVLKANSTNGKAIGHSITCLVLAPGGHVILGASDGSVHIMDINPVAARSGERPWPHHAPPPLVMPFVCLNPSGQHQAIHAGQAQYYVHDSLRMWHAQPSMHVHPAYSIIISSIDLQHVGAGSQSASFGLVASKKLDGGAVTSIVGNPAAEALSGAASWAFLCGTAACDIHEVAYNPKVGTLLMSMYHLHQT